MPAEDLISTKLSVVLVEDNPDDAFLIERHLRRSGFLPEVVRVETAAEMLGVLEASALPDVILADYNLPNFSGPEALHLLKSSSLDIPFIMLSGAVSEENAVSSMRAGAHDYVSKQNLTRLVPAIERELKEASTRRDRLAAELALRASEARFHSLVEAMPLGLLISDGSGRVNYANRAAQRLLGYEGAGALSDSFTLASICPALGEAQALAMSSLSIPSEPFEAVCTTRDGETLEVLIGIAFLNEHAAGRQRQLAAFIADLSLQKKSEEMLRRTEKLAVAGRLAASISHEINNPLEAITNCLYLAVGTDLPAEARTYIEQAQRELDRVAHITVQTLRFYRASTRPSQIDVNEIISTVLTLVEGRLRLRGIEVMQELRADPNVFAHDGEIRQVLANLVGNAIDAVAEGGRIVIRTSSSYDWRQERRGIAITVADNGYGMDLATRKRIFEPFFTTKGMTGTGLGLWICSEIVGKHHGRIRVRSRKDEGDSDGGTVFKIFLPVEQDASV
jgi:PAS domain S-box-containing protein